MHEGGTRFADVRADVHPFCSTIEILIRFGEREINLFYSLALEGGEGRGGE